MRLQGSLKSRVLWGAIWTLGGYGAGQGLRLVSNLVLAWLLFPAAFGLMAIVNSVIQGLGQFSDIGIGPSIIRESTASERFLRTAWTIQVIRGVVLWVSTCILAWPIAHVFGGSDPFAYELQYLLPVVGLCALVSGFQSTAVFTRNRDLAFEKITVLDFVAQATKVCAMILIAVAWPSVWALALGSVLGSIAFVTLGHVWLGGVPHRFAWHSGTTKRLMHFGRWVFASTLVAFMATNADRLVLGNLISLHDLGIYSMSLVFAKTATSVADKLSSAVLFPAFALKARDGAAFMPVVLRARRTVLLSAGVVCSCIAIGSPLFFEYLYDERYAACGQLAQWVTIYTWATILVSTVDRIPLALGKPKVLLVANMLGINGLWIGCLGYYIAGLPGFIMGLSMGKVMSHVYLVRSLPGRRDCVGRQTVAFTLVFGAIIVGSVFGVQLLKNVSASRYVVGVIVVECLVCIVGVSLILRSIRETRRNVAPITDAT